MRTCDMTQEVEIGSLDLRYQGHRVRHATRERQLLSSISERGIDEPLEGVSTPSGPVLLNGFKRLRCARKLHIGAVAFRSLGTDEAMAIAGLLRGENRTPLTMVEQARFVDELHAHHGMAAADIAVQVGRSRGWVGMRLGLMGQMSEAVREKIFAGLFPAYAWVYTLRKFMRMNAAHRAQAEPFVLALSGHNLSVRQVEQLAHGYFLGPESFREQVRAGKVSLALQQIRQVPADPQGCTDQERALLRDLDLAHKYIRRVMTKAMDPRLDSPTFRAQAHLLCTGILACHQPFFDTLRRLHERCTTS